MENTAHKNLEVLKQGFLIWNKFRAGTSISDEKLAFNNLLIDGDNWRFNELKNANLANCEFNKTSIRDIDFLDIDFSGSSFNEISFENVHFANCLFSGTIFNKVVFKGCEWYHSDLTAIQFSGTKQFENITFYKCSFKKDIIESLNLPDEIFEDCTFV